MYVACTGSFLGQTRYIHDTHMYNVYKPLVLVPWILGTIANSAIVQYMCTLQYTVHDTVCMWDRSAPAHVVHAQCHAYNIPILITVSLFSNGD